MCGDDVSVPPPNDDCLEYLWEEVGCHKNGLVIKSSWRSLSQATVSNEMRHIHDSSTVYNYNDDGVYFRYLCFGFLSVSKYNHVLKRNVWSNAGSIDLNIYKLGNVLDGLTNSDQSLGGCALLEIPSSSNFIALELSPRASSLFRKIRFWPSNAKS